MQDLGNVLTSGLNQCWTCPIFDNLFVIISNTAAAAYKRLMLFSLIVFVVLLASYIVATVWKSLKKPNGDTLFQKTVKPVIIKALIALTLLTSGLMVPRIISKVTFEPAAEITYQFSKTMLPDNYIRVPSYNAIPLEDKGFFSVSLRDKIIDIMKTSVSNFQVYVQIGIDIMDKAFSWRAILGIGAFVRHIIIFFVGLYLTYNFGKLFFKYTFCFIDIIVAMAIFAFFFPLSLIFFIFKDSSSAPGWMKKLGADLGSGQIKKLVNAIVSVAATILTYSIIMYIIQGFLTANNVNANDILSSSEKLFDFSLENSGVMEISIAGMIVLVYIINYIAEQVPQITKKIFEAFGVNQEDSLSKEMGENMWNLTGVAVKQVKNFAKTVVNPEKVAEKAAEAATKTN